MVAMIHTEYFKKKELIDDLSHVTSIEAAREYLENNVVDLIVLDNYLIDGKGIEYLPELKGYPIIMITAANDVQRAPILRVPPWRGCSLRWSMIPARSARAFLSPAAIPRFGRLSLRHRQAHSCARVCRMHPPRLSADAPRASSRVRGVFFSRARLVCAPGCGMFGTCPRVCARSRSCHVRFALTACGCYLATSSGAAIPLVPHRSVS